MSPKRRVFFLSDGTGITAETMGNSLLSQFDDIEFEKDTVPFIDTVEKAEKQVEIINKIAEEDGVKPLVFDTMVNREVRDTLLQCKGFTIDIFGAFIKPLEDELEIRSSHSVGKTHSIINSESYKIRIEAVHFALDNDDGARTRHYDQADIIIIGVSRSGKTPSCLYLAMQFGIRAANYPLTEDDLDDLHIPKTLKIHRNKLFGLSIDTDRLVAIRNERKPNSKYSSFRQVDMEVRGAEALYAKERIPSINTTHYSVEEISTRILATTGLERRIIT
ncbi:MAG: kinase/pyrophosphorylase [Pseudomonadales bacterium]|nr:kinase/pyrophosphorylase [Pseudomonadales bacterium]